MLHRPESIPYPSSGCSQPHTPQILSLFFSLYGSLRLSLYICLCVCASVFLCICVPRSPAPSSSRDQESLPKGSTQAISLGAILIGPGQPTERLCSYFVAQSNKRGNQEGSEEASEAGIDTIVSWNVERLYLVDIIGVMCGVSNDSIQTVVSSGAVPCLLNVLR